MSSIKAVQCVKNLQPKEIFSQLAFSKYFSGEGSESTAHMMIHLKQLLPKNYSPSLDQSPSRMYDVLSKFSNTEVRRDSDSISLSYQLSLLTPHFLLAAQPGAKPPSASLQHTRIFPPTSASVSSPKVRFSLYYGVFSRIYLKFNHLLSKEEARNKPCRGDWGSRLFLMIVHLFGRESRLFGLNITYIHPFLWFRVYADC
jgi:hypothetical protein